LPFLIHQELRRELSEKRAFKIEELLEKSIGTVLESAREMAVQKKVELRDELSKELASKGDLALVKTELKGDIAELRSELKADIAELRAELKTEIAELRSELLLKIEREDIKHTILSICMLFAIFLTNKDAIVFLAQLLG